MDEQNRFSMQSNLKDIKEDFLKYDPLLPFYSP